MRDASEDLGCLLGSAEPSGVGITNGLHFVDWSGRIEDECAVANLYVQNPALVCELPDSSLKPPFSDVTPWADHIGGDFDAHCCHDRGMQSADVTATFCATLVDEWLSLGVKLAIVSPGSRSTPMALALADRSDLRLEVVHDERSAAFFALGAGKLSGTPAVLLCTSGTAAANFFPAVVEACHADVPMLVVTADRPPELQGVGAPQTIDQRDLYGSYVRRFVDPGVADDDQRGTWRRVARRTFRAAVGDRPGPVHLNLPFREPLVGVAGTLPPEEGTDRPVARRRLGSEQLAKLTVRVANRRGVIVAGQGSPQYDRLIALARQLSWPVLADPLSGIRADEAFVIRHADVLLRDSDLAARLTPDSVLRFGALPASKVLCGWLRDCGAETTTVTDGPNLVDPDRRTSLHLVTDPDEVCKDLVTTARGGGAEWLSDWLVAEDAARGQIARLLDDEDVLSEPGIARAMVSGMPAGSAVVLSSSMPIRDVEWFSGACNHLKVLSNRGVNGIDGVVSTAIGAALAGDSPVGLLIGDVAFLHDSGALVSLVERKVDLRMVVVNNNGGGIFSFLPQRGRLSLNSFEKLFGTPHRSNIPALAAAHGVVAVTVRSTRELQAQLAKPGPYVVEVSTNRDANVSRHEEINQAVAVAAREALS